MHTVCMYMVWHIDISARNIMLYLVAINSFTKPKPSNRQQSSIKFISEIYAQQLKRHNSHTRTHTQNSHTNTHTYVSVMNNLL